MDLFSGCGGLTSGVKKAGFTVDGADAARFMPSLKDALEQPLLLALEV